MNFRAAIASAVLGSLLAIGCGPTSGGEPEFLALDDHTVQVGDELFIELRASDPDTAVLEFSFTSILPDIDNRTSLQDVGTSAIFRFVPVADDIGTWVFDFTVSDGANTSTESLTVTVEATADGAPVFRQPSGAGTTLDLTAASCLDLDVVVDDADSTIVIVEQAEPIIEGAELIFGMNDEIRWSWCPSPAQIASGDSFQLALSADDGDTVVVKHFLIVLRNQELVAPVDLSGFSIHQEGAACDFIFPAGLEVERGGTLVVARDASKAAFEAFWGVTLPAESVFISAADACPRINGDESFTLLDNAGALVDGPTPVMFAHENFQRIKGTLSAGSVDSWSITTDTAADPGRAPTDPDAGGIFISEFSDADGAGNFTFEFVEIAVE